MVPPHPSLVGLVEIADRLRVKRGTVDIWRHRQLMPEPRWMVSGTPLWEWEAIEAWAKETGRL